MGEVYTLRQFSDKHPAFPVGGLRWLRFNSPANGYGKAFIKQGGKVLIDEIEFFKALKSNAGETNHAAA